ncbi:MAG TPA: T9SS type A sorting domain-containing protein, partial [Caldithrix sp.]|nr:T9SS type A sorting domain-containing protein [Caldithrix sp.]
IISIQEILKYMAVNVLTGSWVDYWFNKNNFYIYHEPTEDRFHLLPYDYDNTFGISWFGTDWTDVNPYYFAEYEGQQGSRPLTDAILAIPACRNLYTHFLEFYTGHVFNLNVLNSRIDSLKTLIENPWIKADSFYTRSYGFTADDFDKSYSADGYYFEPHVRRGLKEFINLRVEALESQFDYITSPPALYYPQWTSSDPHPNDTIFVSISIFDPDEIHSAGIILVNGSQEKPFSISAAAVDDSPLVEMVDRWSGFIPPLSESFSGGFYFVAQDNKGQISRYPGSGLIPLITGNSEGKGIKINEFLADNNASNMDQDNEYDDWLELYNTDTIPQLISGKYLTDNPQLLNKWLIPGENVYLIPGEHLLIWCDEDDQAGYHTNFKLSKSGEYIGLAASDGITILDSLSFSSQQTDTSFGRLPDGSDSWVYMTPTPGAANFTTDLIDPVLSLPEKFNFKLYPNPFNSLVVIEFDLSISSKVILKIYNTLGETIQTRETSLLNKGPNRMLIDMNKQPSGMYFISLDTGKYQAVNKMLLIR